VTGNRVEVFGRDQNMKGLNEGIVQNEHDRSGVPSPRFTPEEHLADITNISNFWMAETEFPGTVKGDPRIWDTNTHQRTKEVYKTTPAIKTVKMRPGTRPKTEYE